MVKMSYRNSFNLKSFPENSIENIITAKLGRRKNPDNSEKKIIKKALKELFYTKYIGIALDFDGTIIPINEREKVINSKIKKILLKLNRKNIPLFILTGRGSSIFKQLKINEFENKRMLFIGQYNGGKALYGDGELIYEHKMSMLNSYSTIKNFLIKNKIKFKEKISSFVCIDNSKAVETCYRFIRHFLDWKIFSTNYSFDILPQKISKKKALLLGIEILGINDSDSVLKIGDAGDVDGNDYDFLSLGNSFSVGEYSNDLKCIFPIINEKNEFLIGPKGLEYLFKYLKYP